MSDNLRYRNQFVLGPVYVEGLPSWQRLEVHPGVHLTVHPDLNTYQAVWGDKSLTLLGFMLDPHNPRNRDSDIVNALIRELSDADGFIERTYKFGGRWILIVNDGKKLRLFNDAVGLRQVFYTDGDRRPLWCASQPGIIADLLNLEMDPEAVDFINSYEFRKNPEFRWPGNSSPYRDIKHLLPNHYLNPTGGCCRRYWPDRPLSELSFQQAVVKASSMLRGLMESASKRFDLALSVTAGLDSRVVLAASRDIRDSVAYMTVRQIGMPDDHADITIPSRLLGQLGLKHDVVDSSLIIDDEFLKIFKQNVPLAHYIYAPDAQAILNYYGQGKVAVTGSTSEVSRSSFRALLNSPRHKSVCIQDFADLQNMGRMKFVLDHFDNWHAGLGETYNLDVLNLFEWELDDGNWLAMCQLEFDIAWKDIFAPFNCRDLIITMQSVKPQYLRAPDYTLYQALISNLWPEVLSVPINPHKKRPAGFSSKLKGLLKF